MVFDLKTRGGGGATYQKVIHIILEAQTE
jgi:hypothetical protein